MRFDGKVCVVTGGAGGIGRQTALTFAKEGADIALIDIMPEPLEKVKGELEAFGHRVATFVCDVSNGEQVSATVTQIVKDFGKIDVMVNNAGITRDDLLIRMTEEAWDDVLRINLKSMFLFTKAVARPMMKARAGVIINTASIIGMIGNAGQGNYAAAKGGAIAFTKSMAKELASRNIRVNAVAPGFIQTRMTDALPETVREQMLANIPLGRLGQPDDIAKCIAFLASDDASYITGQTLNISGGMVI